MGRAGGEIDPATMPITRIVNSAIDGVVPRQAEVVDDLVRYAGSDLIYYRSGEPERLAHAQEAAWSPVLDWARERTAPASRWRKASCMWPSRRRPFAAIRGVIERINSPFALAALHVMTTLSGSVLIALAHAGGGSTWIRPGPPPMWTSFSRRASGARTTRPWSTGAGARPISGRRPRSIGLQPHEKAAGGLSQAAFSYARQLHERRKVMPQRFWIEASSTACIWPLRRASSAVWALLPPTKKAAGQKMTTAVVVATTSLVRDESWAAAAAAAALTLWASALSSRQLWLE